LAANQLSGTVPSAIGNLNSLQDLQLHLNQLTSLPPEIGNLTQLKRLWIYDNQLTSLPSEISSLMGLEWLVLHDNPLDGEVPDFLTALTQLNYFLFYDTNWCVPLTGNVPAWLDSINEAYGPGDVCDQEPGSLSGTVTLTDTTPLAGIQVNLYRSLLGNQWRHISVTQTITDGTYQFTELGQGQDIDYRVHFVGRDHQLASQYYDDQATIEAATVITITPSVPKTGIDAALSLPQAPVADLSAGNGSITYSPDGTAQIVMPKSNLSDVVVTRTVTCTTGTLSTVTLTLSTGPEYPMTNVSGDRYRATIATADLTANATLSVAATCGVTTTETIVGELTLYDPSGQVTDYLTGQPISGATVTLYNVPDWVPKTGPDDDCVNTCESNLSKAEDDSWSQPAPTNLGTIANADVTPTDPTLPYQQTNVDGYYGWDVSEGCWYVTVEAEGYELLVSPVVGIPPEVTDLNLALKPEGMRQVYLPLVMRSSP
jgi:hypothetical protein